jgi:hypothetical protein
MSGNRFRADDNLPRLTQKFMQCIQIIIMPVAVRSLSSLQSFKSESVKLDLSQYLKGVQYHICIFANVLYNWATRKRQFSALMASVTLLF